MYFNLKHDIALIKILPQSDFNGLQGETTELSHFNRFTNIQAMRGIIINHVCLDKLEAVFSITMIETPNVFCGTMVSV